MSQTNYNEQLQSNNTDLQSILDTINALPEAYGKENIELIFSWEASYTSKPTVFYSYYYNNQQKTAVFSTLMSTGTTTLTVAKGELIFITCKDTTSTAYGVTAAKISGDIIALPNNLGDSAPGFSQMPVFKINTEGTLNVTVGYDSGTSSSGGSG